MGMVSLFTDILNRGSLTKDRGLVEISGVFKGSICRGYDVLIAPNGRLYGRIQARKVEIAGVVQGDVEAESMVIHSSGQLYYDKLKCEHLSVKDGGTMVNMVETKNPEYRELEKSKEDHPVDVLTTDYIPESPVKQVEPISGNDLERPDDDQYQQNNDIGSLGGLQSEGVKHIQQQQKIHTLKINEQKPHCSPKQPRFYSSY